ncbi:hypothetical protein [Streptomyces sp. NPDC002176]|uniref:hypothetical protein n=1 Tax=Streptomyces sp. NPDC002176 TaxID=3364634 RepID=UPI00384CA8A9
MSDLLELSELRVRRERWIDAPPQTVYDLFPVMGESREELLDLKAHNTAGMEATLDSLAGVAAARVR